MRKEVIKYHVFLWILIIVSGWISEYVYKGTEYFMTNFAYPYLFMALAFNLCLFTVYWINYRYICPKYLDKKPRYRFLLAVFILLIGFAGLRYVLEEVVVYQITGKHNYVDRTRKLFFYTFDNALYAVKPVLYSTIFYLLENYIYTKNKVHQLEFDRKSAELNLLKSQIEPHFLFNTLNTFYTELIQTQPETAKDIHRMSDLLRYITYETKNDYMPLESELKFIDDYRYFYKKRFEDQLFLDYQLDGNPAEHKIPSMLLIHFFENIYKHGVLNEKANPASIHITISNDHLTLVSKNKISKVENYTEKGIGSANLKRRLDNLFDDKYVLEVKTEDDWYHCELRIPLTA